MMASVDLKTISLDEWNELQSELQTLRADKLSYDSIADGLSTELESLRQQLNDKETNCQSYSESNAAIRSSITSLNTKYEKVMIEKSDALSTITELKATLCDLQNENKNYKKQNHRLQVQNDEFSEELSDSNNKLFSIQSQFNEAIKAKNELNAEKRRIETNKQCIEIELNSYKSQICIFESQMKAYQEEVINAKKEFNAKHSQDCIKMDDFQRSIDALQRELKTKQQMLKNRDECIQQKIECIDQLQSTSNETKRSLEHKLLSLKQQIASFESAKNAEERRREIVEDEKEKMMIKQQDLNATLVKYKSKIALLSQQNKKMSIKLKQIRTNPHEWDTIHVYNEAVKLQKTATKSRRLSILSNSNSNISQIEGTEKEQLQMQNDDEFDIESEGNDTFERDDDIMMNDDAETPSGFEQIGDVRLKNKFLKLCDTVRTLYGALDSLEIQNEELQSALNRQGPFSQMKKLEFEQIKKENEQFEIEVEELTQRMNGLKAMNDGLKVQYDDMRKKYAKAMHEKDELRRNVVQNLHERFKNSKQEIIQSGGGDVISKNYMDWHNVYELVAKQQNLMNELRESKQSLEEYKEHINKATKRFKVLNETRIESENEKIKIEKVLQEMTKRIHVLEGKGMNCSKEEMDESDQSDNDNVTPLDVSEWKLYAQEREKEHDLYRETKQKQIECLQYDMIRIKNQNEIMQNKENELKKLNDSLTRKIEDFEQMFEQKVAQINELNVNINTLKTEKKGYNEQIRNYKDELIENQRRLQSLQSEKCAYNEQNNSFKQIIKDLQNEINDKCANKDDNEQQQQSNNVSLIDLKSILEETKDKDLQFLTKQNELNKEINELMVSNSNLIKDKDVMIKELNATKSKMKQVNDKYAVLESKYVILENKYSECKSKKQSELNGIQQQIKEFMEQSQLHQKQTSIDIAQLHSNQSSQEPHLQQSELESIKNENEQTKQRLIATQTELKSTEQQFHFWKNKAINCQTELDDASKEYKKLNEIFDECMKDKDGLQQSLTLFRSESAQKIGNLETKMNKINEKMEEKTKECALLKDEIVRCKENEINLENRLEQIVKDKDEAQNNYQEELEEHANALEEIEATNTKLMALKQELLQKEDQINEAKLQIVKITQTCKQREIELEKQQNENEETKSLLLEEQRNLSEQIEAMNDAQNDKKIMTTSASNEWVWGQNDNEQKNENAEDEKMKKIIFDNAQLLSRYKERLASLNRELHKAQLNEEKLAQQNENHQKQIIFYKQTLEKQLKKNSEQNTPTKSQKFIAELQNVSAINESNKLLKDGQKQRDERILKLEFEHNEKEKEMAALKDKFCSLKGEKAVLENGYEQIQKELQIMRENHQLIVTKYQKIDPNEYERLLSMESVKKELQSQVNKYQAMLIQSKQIIQQNKSKIQGINQKNSSLLSQIQSMKQQVKKMEIEKQKLINENSSKNAMILKNNSMIAKYKQVMDNKKKEMMEKNKQIKELKDVLAQNQNQNKKSKVVNTNVNNPNFDLLTKRLSVLSNLLQQKKLIIDKLMNEQNVKKGKVEKLNAQLVANNKMLSDEKEKSMLQQSEIKALRQLCDGLKNKIEQQKKQMIKVENELKAIKMAKIEKEKSLTPQQQQQQSSDVNVQLSGNKRKRNMMNEEDAMRNVSENKQNIEPPFKRYKVTNDVSSVCVKKNDEEEIKKNVPKDDVVAAPPLESVSNENVNDDDDNDGDGSLTPITDVDDDDEGEENENENENELELEIVNGDDNDEEEATSEEEEEEDDEEEEEEYSGSDDDEEQEEGDGDGEGEEMIDLCSSDDGN